MQISGFKTNLADWPHKCKGPGAEARPACLQPSKGTRVAAVKRRKGRERETSWRPRGITGVSKGSAGPSLTAVSTGNTQMNKETVTDNAVRKISWAK